MNANFVGLLCWLKIQDVHRLRTNLLTCDSLRRIFQNYFNVKPMNQFAIKPGWNVPCSFTKCVFFVVLIRKIKDGKWNRSIFFSENRVRLNPNWIWIIVESLLRKFCFFLCQSEIQCGHHHQTNLIYVKTIPNYSNLRRMEYLKETVAGFWVVLYVCFCFVFGFTCPSKKVGDFPSYFILIYIQY